jgi:transaldolase
MWTVKESYIAKKEKSDGLLFLDTASLPLIKKYLDLGIIDGVTTNPTIMKKDGVVGGFKVIKQRTIEIAEMIYPRPLSVETSSPEGNKHELIDQATEFASWKDNINVKVTFTTQKGKSNTDVISKLAKAGIKVNATAMMSVSQCFLAAKTGATYVSLFAGRIANMGYDPRPEINRLRSLLDRIELPAQIIAASTREALNVTQWSEAGAHIVTVTPDLLKPCIDHPYTRETVAMFDGDAAEWVKEWREAH